MKKTALSFATVLLTTCLALPPAGAIDLPTPHDAREALISLMDARHAAQSLAVPDATPQQLQQAASQLEQLRALLEQQPYHDFAQGNQWVAAERLNLAIPLAEIYLRLGQREAALRALESTTRVSMVPGLAALAGNPKLAAIKDEPRFQAVLDKYRRGGALGGRDTLASPYVPALRLEQRVAGLSLFWSEVRRSFANPDLGPAVNWDAVYLDYLGQVSKAESTQDYYAILMRLAPLLHDGHTNIYPPEELSQHFYARPGVTPALVENTVVIQQVRDEKLKQQLHPGEQIVAIDGMEAKAYAEKFVRPLVSASTQQDSDLRTFSYQLLAGERDRPVTLTLRGADGKQRDVVLPRSGWEASAEPRFPFRMLPNGIAYLRLDHFESADGPKAFEQALPQIRAAKALILDLRTNGGGSTDYGTEILLHLVDKPLQPTSSRVRFEDASVRAQQGDYIGWQSLPEAVFAPPMPAEQRFNGPVAVLTGPRTFSAAEDFTAMFVQAKRGIVVGEATAGSTGQPLFLKLPGGGTARICAKRDSYSDGSDFVGSGIQPNITVRQTVAALRTGQDLVLERAQQALLASHLQMK
jgi:C-terminal processing protease CtpA/Prc